VNNENRALSGFEELRFAIEEEESYRPTDFVIEPILAQIWYISNTLTWDLGSADIGQFVTSLGENFALRLDTQAASPEELQVAVSEGQEMSFSGGILLVEDLGIRTPITTLSIGGQRLSVIVAGTTAEARWVAQQVISLLYASYGIYFRWADFLSTVVLIGHQTVTRTHIGINHTDLLSDRFKDFMEGSLVEPGSLGSKMGQHLFDGAMRSTEEGGRISVPQVNNIEMRLQSFYKTTGRSQESEISFGLFGRQDQNQGVLTITTELDSIAHIEFIKQLRSAILG